MASEIRTESFVPNIDIDIDVMNKSSNSVESYSSPDKSAYSLVDSEGYHSRISDGENSGGYAEKVDSFVDKGSPSPSTGNVDGEESDIESDDEQSKRYRRDYDAHHSRSSDGDLTQINGYSTAEAKKARVENIITSMRHYPTDFGGESQNLSSLEMRGRKRKQYHPQQHETQKSNRACSSAADEGNFYIHAQIRDLHHRLQYMRNNTFVDNCNLSYAGRLYGDSDFGLESDVNVRPTDYNDNTTSPVKRQVGFKDKGNSSYNGSNVASNFSSSSKKFKFSDDPKEFEEICAELKRRISRAIDGVIDEFIVEFAEYQKTLKEQLKKRCEMKETLSIDRPLHYANPFHWQNTSVNSNHCNFVDNPLRNLVESLNSDRIHHPIPAYPPLPYYRYFPTSLPPLMPHAQQANLHPPVSTSMSPEPEQTEALALVVNTPKKKRTKVTDTRLSPRAARSILQDGFAHETSASADGRAATAMNGFHNSTTAISQRFASSIHGIQHSDFVRFMKNDSPLSNTSCSRDGKQSPLQADQGSPGASNVTSSESARLSNRNLVNFDNPPHEVPPFYQLTMPYTSTLTPMHLRKAKLMFFYVRYPSSTVLKTYFPDIHFNKNNTAQLVKWFSNFREFFYIQMEKYARQMIAEGVKLSGDIHVTTESEIFRVLNLHYNRNNQLEVPEQFRQVIEISLREFFVAILNGKDSEQPWKKSIYKVIQRLDEKLPDCFLSPNWIELLGES